MTKKSRNSFLLNQTETYHKLIIQTFDRLVDEKFDRYLRPLFVMACSSGLEYFLNSVFIDFAYQNFPRYREYAFSYTSLNFKSKLILAPPTVSSNKFIFNENNGDFKNPKRLISRRNEILHNKDFFFEAGLEKDLEDEQKLNIQIKASDWKKAIKTQVDSINKRECQDYKKAIDHFCEDFLFPYNKNKLKSTDLVIENKR